MSIASALKYAVFLEERSKSLREKISQVECTRVTQKVISSSEATSVVEQVEFTLSPKELMSEYDKNAKELRLVREAIETANHTTQLEIDAKF